MKWFADANVEFAIVRWLRAEGFDTAWGLEYPPGTSDEALLDVARTEGRIFLTHDRDFGELVFRRGLADVPVVLLRLSGRLEAERLEALQRWWPTLREVLERPAFVVVGDAAIRVRKLSP